MIEIREATARDGQALQELQARCPQGTTLVVQTVNAPDFFDRMRAYPEGKVFIAMDNNTILGSMACALREANIGGERVRVGYQFQGFTAPEARRRKVAAALLEHGHKYLADRGVTLVYALIMEGNFPSMRLCEAYGFARKRDLVMVGLPVFTEVDDDGRHVPRPVSGDDLTTVAELLNQTWEGLDFFEPATADGLESFLQKTPGHGLDNLLIAEHDGRIKAALGYWDWSRVMRVKVLSRSRRMKVIGWMMRLTGIFRPMPRMPQPGQEMKQWMLTPIGFDEPDDLAPLVRRVYNLARQSGVNMVFAISEPDHPMLKAFRGLVRVDTALYLYLKTLRPGVALGDGPVFIDGVDL